MKKIPSETRIISIENRINRLVTDIKKLSGDSEIYKLGIDTNGLDYILKCLLLMREDFRANKK